MILPTSYPSALILLVLGMLCWGTWANTQKMTGKWRFELFYYDFALGILVFAVLAAFTLGTLNSKELTFQDNFLIASYHNMAYSLGAGVVFNIGNIFFVGAITVSAMAVVFPLSLGLAMVVVGIWSYMEQPRGSFAMLLGGLALVLFAVILQSLAYSGYVGAKRAVAKAMQPDPRDARIPRSARPPSAAKGIVLSFLSGILIGLSYLLVDAGRSGENGVSPYGLGLLFAGGLFLSTLLFNPFFINFPVYGKAIELSSYFKGTGRQHLLGIAGGMLWMAGALASIAALSAPPAAQPGPVVTAALLQSVMLVGLLWGIVAWNEFKGASERVKFLIAAMLILYCAGAGLVAVAPVYGN
jgi:glucose uptake protein